MPKLIALLILILSPYTFLAQEPATEETPYSLPAPKDWFKEKIPFPIGFAPSIPYKGIEDIRFTPGWAKKTSEEYWSYAFLWYLDGKVKIKASILDSNMKAYYTGLIAANGSNIPPGKLIPVTTSFKKIKKNKGDKETYSGTITMLDYMKKEPITLNCKVHLKYCGDNNTVMFFELSPKPELHPVWVDLDKLWAGFSCDTKTKRP